MPILNGRKVSVGEFRRAAAEVRWRDVDLTRDARTLAFELGVDVGVIYRRRHFVGIKQTNKWEGVDLTRDAKEIAFELGVTPGAVYKERAKYGIRTTKAIDWTGVDLSRPAKEIAAELKVSVTAVYKKRTKRQKEGGAQ